MLQKPVQGSSIPTAFSVLNHYWVLITDQRYNEQEPYRAITYMEAALPREGDSRGRGVFDPTLRGVPEVRGEEWILLGKI